MARMGNKLENKEELVAYLYEAQRVENAILAQYLFAAMTIRRDWEKLSSAQAEFLRESRELLYTIAREEMFHLGWVCNALLGLGLCPNLSASNYRKSSQRWFNKAFNLASFSGKTLDALIAFEAPLEIVSDAQTVPWSAAFPIYDRVGDLYTKLADAYADPKIVPAFANGVTKYFLDTVVSGYPGSKIGFIRLDAPIDVARQFEILRDEGEGSKKTELLRPSHYSRLKAHQERWRKDFGGDDSWVAYPVPMNPQADLQDGFAYLDRKQGFLRVFADRVGVTQLLGAAPRRNHIKSETAQVAALFDHVYQTLMLMLDQYFSPLNESPCVRSELFMVARGAMVGIMHPLGELVAELPLAPDSPLNAGPPFVLRRDVTLPYFQDARWQQLKDRIDGERQKVVEITGNAKSPLVSFFPRLRNISESLEVLHTRITKLAISDEPEECAAPSAGGGQKPEVKSPTVEPCLTLGFKGFFVCRLATNPDQFDEPWGMYEGPRVYPPGEDRLDRIIRTDPHCPKSKVRTGCPQTVGINVTGGTLRSQNNVHVLANFADHYLTFEGNPVFDGRNGLKAQVQAEHISPMIVALRNAAGDVIAQAAVQNFAGQIGQKKYDSTVRDLVKEAEAEAAFKKGEQLLTRRRVEKLDLLISEKNSDHELVVLALRRHRLAAKRETKNIPLNERLPSIGFASTFSYTLDDIKMPLPPINGFTPDGAPWKIDFLMGAFDFDAMCGFISGELTIPLNVASGEMAENNPA